MFKAASVVAVLVIAATLHYRWNTEVVVPELEETFWGAKKTETVSTEIRPFKIDFPATEIEELQARLKLKRRLREPLENAAWTYGVPSTALNAVIDHWMHKYNWSERQKLLNKYPQFKTNIQGLDIHFCHVKPTGLPKERKIQVRPLLLLHGWPGSIVEFQKIIPMLTTPRPDVDFVFEVIAPSLPGYGFSEAAVRPGLAPAQMATIFKNLMARLGFNEFYVQGGDWGSIIASSLAALYPEKVRGMHGNMCISNSASTVFWKLLGNYLPFLVVSHEHYSRMYPLGQHFPRMLEETGYMHIQATKPDTIGVALSNSPIGLAAYILEKFSTWTNPEYRFRSDGGLTDKFNLDELLDNVMIYWLTNSITTSVRLYAEQFSQTYRAMNIDEAPINVPSACANFPHELQYTPESLIRMRYKNLIQYNHMPRGGHFAAFEEPGLLADDVFSFVQKVEEMSSKETTQKPKATPESKAKSKKTSK